jgi:hypothetical protein
MRFASNFLETAMPIIYPSLAIGAKRRLELFRKEAAQKNWARPMTWRDVRFAKLTSESGLTFNGEHWYVHSAAPVFNREQDAHDVEGIRIDHTGWFTDIHGDEKAVGIIAKLPRGRFLAGYRWTSNDERVYYPEIYADAIDAARGADSHAESFADIAREDSEKYEEARKLENKIEDSLIRLRECIVLRHSQCMSYVRDEARELVETIREARESLRTDYADYN